MFDSLEGRIDEFISLHPTSLFETILILLRHIFKFNVDHADAPVDFEKPNLHKILTFLYEHDTELVTEWANQLTTSVLLVEMSQLASKDVGFHFQAKKTTESKLKEFNIQEMATTMQRVGPAVWKLFSMLLEADLMQ